jgi:molybdenum cofactor cytidylyltransferase
MASWHHGVVTLGELFTPVPLRWGLRGDPHLWEAMRQRFADHAFPADQWSLMDAVRSAFEELTGVRLDANIGHVPIPAYRTGSGISDGVVDGDWWHDVGQALLLDRWNVASASDHHAR